MERNFNLLKLLVFQDIRIILLFVYVSLTSLPVSYNNDDFYCYSRETEAKLKKIRSRTIQGIILKTDKNRVANKT